MRLNKYTDLIQSRIRLGFFVKRGFCNKKVQIKKWTSHVEPIESEAETQIHNLSKLGNKIIHGHIAVMPDVHLGKGATVGTVIPTKSAIIPGAVGVDIGCGMCAVKTSLTLNDIKLDSLKRIRKEIENIIPLGFDGTDSPRFKKMNLLEQNHQIWTTNLKNDFEKICNFEGINKSFLKTIEKSNTFNHLGSLGGGNHFIELCIDDTHEKGIWIMLHSGSRGVGNAIGRTFIELAKEDMLSLYGNLPLDKDLAYFCKERSPKYFDSYWFSVKWAQKFASLNREIMMKRIIERIRKSRILPEFDSDLFAVNCHHNYVDVEKHFGEDIYVTRKGAVSAKKGELGIIPGSMGAKSYIVRGKGNKQSYCSCSHGAGRKMSRNEAKKKFDVNDLKEQTKGVECKKDVSVIDEIPYAYKDIDKVMKSQEDLVEIVYTLKQILCVKG